MQLITGVMIQILNTAKENTIVAFGVSGATVFTAIANGISWFTGNLTAFGLFAGFFLSIVLSISHIRKMFRDKEKAQRDKEKHDLEIEIQNLEIKKLRQDLGK